MFERLKEDVRTVFDKDPAARSWLEVVTCYPGLHAVWLHRAAHWLWTSRLRLPARCLSHVSRFLTGIEIHPAATIGRRFFIDHGMGVVIGETSEVGDDVLLYKGVVLGGTSLSREKRHPTVGDGVVIGSNAVILGPVSIGHRSRIGSGAVVVKPVPEDSTAVGVPAKVVRGPHVEPEAPSVLDHAELPDPLAETYNRLVARVEELEHQLWALTEELKDNHPAGRQPLRTHQ